MFWPLLLISILVLVIFIIVYFIGKRRVLINTRDQNVAKPYYYSIPEIFFFSLNMKPENFLQEAEMQHQVHGDILYFLLPFTSRKLVATCDVEIIEQILTSPKHIVKHRNYKILKPWLGIGLLISDGQKWFKRRRIITPAFHFKILEEFVSVFDQQTNILLDCLEEKANGLTSFDIYPYIGLAALDIIAETAMGTKVYAQSNTSTKYITAVKGMTKMISWRFMKIYLHDEILFSILCPHLKIRQANYIKTLHDFTIKVIKERRRTLANTLASEHSSVNKDDAEVSSKKRMALLDILLQSSMDGKSLSNEDIREEVDTFMFEGHDTSTTAISFALHLIARHPAVQNKLLTEIVQVLGKDKKHPIVYTELSDLKYMECVLKETMRLYPPVPVIGRDITENFVYTHSKMGKSTIEAGTELVMHIHMVMRNPKYFENPNDFIPERFQNNANSSGFTFVPFSAEPRNCIGQKFAMLEMKTMLAKIIRQYELLPLGEAVVREDDIVLRSGNGCQLGLKKRTA